MTFNLYPSSPKPKATKSRHEFTSGEIVTQSRVIWFRSGVRCGVSLRTSQLCCVTP